MDDPLPESCVFRVHVSLYSSDKGSGPYGGDWSSLCGLGGFTGNTKVTFQWSARKYCKCEVFRDCETTYNESANSSPYSSGFIPQFTFEKCYDLGDCDPDVVCQRYEFTKGETTVDFAGCDARELDEFCRCKEQAELRCGLIDYWSAPGPTHDPCHKRAMQEFHSCLDKLRDDGERSGSLPKCMQDKISQAIDDMFSPGSTTEGIQAAKDYCAHKDEEGATSGLMNRIGTSIRDQQEAKKRDSTIPRGGIYGN